MFRSLLGHWKMIGLLTTCALALSTVSLSTVDAKSASSQASPPPELAYPQYGEWRYNPQGNPPTLMWWNERMPMVPVLYISFLPNQIILNAVTPVWPDTGIVFYIKDQSDKLGLNLTLLKRTDKNNFYQAIIYGAKDEQDFINNLVTSRKARLITPSSYSQSLSLKHVYDAMTVIISNHPDLHFTLPNTKQTQIMTSP